MPCFHPLRGYRSDTPNPSGKFPLVGIKARTLDRPLPPGSKWVEIPCGRCWGCRLEYSRVWALRCLHESQMWPENVFITLTYSPANLPANGFLVERDLQLFWKRLRKIFPHRKIRYYACGEYGDENHRPHYHAIVFNLDFKDKIFLRKTSKGDFLYSSPTLDKVWGLGRAWVGAVTFESAAYVARYVMKKWKGPKGSEHFTILDPSTGELLCRPDEFVRMSRGGKGKFGNLGGIGSTWYEKFTSDVFPSDQVILRGKAVKPPRYYSVKYELTDAVAYALIKERRNLLAELSADDNTLKRLSVREKVIVSKLKSRSKV